jgi:outer membrane receptor protein involved in Fe transport
VSQNCRNFEKGGRPAPRWEPRGRSVTAILLAVLCIQSLARLQAQTSSVIEGTLTDPQGAAIVGGVIFLSGSGLAGETQALSNALGLYRLAGLPAGTYNLRVFKPGFATKLYTGLPVAVNRVLSMDVALVLGTTIEEVTVTAGLPLIEAGVSSSGATILPQQIEQMPLNGRDYLDLMQLVPGVAVNRQVDAGTDTAVAVLGERGGNASFLVDGMPNRNSVDGGSASPFNQDSILEFQVLTTGYTAEFGHGSGGVVNVVSKSGANQWHGLVSAFHRNSAFDSSNVPGKATPFLLRWDPSANLGGPIMKDRVFFFASLERIRETRQLNFLFPSGVPEVLRAYEETLNRHSQIFETRSFVKLDELAGRHRITEQMSLTNNHVTDFLPLSQATSLPSARTNLDSRYLMLGFHDTATLGNRSNPFLLSVYLQFRGEPLIQRPAHPEASPATTLFNEFSGLNTGRLTGDLGQVRFGAGFTPLLLRQGYTSAGAHLEKLVGRHDIKFGWDFQQIRVNGTEAGNLLSQLFATVSDYGLYGPVNSGVYVLTRVAGPTQDDNLIRLRNTYDGLFAQDDWKVSKHLTLNAGLRWDSDSRFPNRGNFSPRIGVAWAATPKTLVNASWGLFYDSFRLGLARDVPGFGGANLYRNQTISFPRLFYGDPSTVPQLGGLCLSSALTDAQIAGAGAPCPIAGSSTLGIDHLNAVVAPGHAPIPANAIVSLDNVQTQTGLNPQQFADAASAAVNRQPGFFSWGGFGNLTMNFVAPRIFSIPITVEPGFHTPYTRAFHVGAQREITGSIAIQADYYHRDIRNMLGVRITNLAFEARIPGHTGELQAGTGARPILSYGPWYQGRYDGIGVGIHKVMSNRFTMEASYTWTNAVDNAFNSSLASEVQIGLGAGALAGKGPTDSFVGVPILVKDPVTGQTNATGSFIASNGNPVPQAGKFYNGPNLDRGPSDLALNHTLLIDGIFHLPRQFVISGIFRAQSGFHYTGSPATPADVDGDGLINGVDFQTGRNHFQAPPYANLDLRIAKEFAIRERIHVKAVVEFFNLLNRANPAAVEQLENVSVPLGKPLQYLPGREGQLGLRIEF